ncbi:ABC transporter permease [Demequina sp. TTPB684]|uniref:ABC transporter permease n=1 Tax=unclassified Demequina TaxID=2620311 RepID=UPI001CF1E811|nr:MULTISPECIES: ABC transporter permease [unclassified Demequina]MCB2411652.1 ABC transporter permease [Demequina sp. TTPB684]UPU88048.1 ABC transporter permease [Demequina sp. TMPB413]
MRTTLGVSTAPDMGTALALQWATFSRSATARVATALAVLAAPVFGIGMVALARSGAITGTSAAKFEPFVEGAFGDAVGALVGQILTVVMVLAAGFAVAWLFGREFADRTYGSLFALPVSRAQLGWAKVMVAAAWAVACVTFAVALTTLGLAIAATAGLEGAAVTGELLVVLARDGVAGVLMGLLGLPFGWVAVRSRGYIGALGGIIAVVAASQILASLGLGRWVPYVAPALWAGAGGDEAATSVGVPQLLWALAFAGLGAWAAVRAFAGKGRF